MQPAKFFVSCVFAAIATAGCTAAPTVSQPTAASAQSPATTQPAPAQPVAEKKPAPATNQGIAAGEPAPGTSPSGTTAILTPCRREFMAIDTNGDGWIDPTEWGKVKGTDAQATADFKAEDADHNGQLDNGEYGCQDTAPNGGTPSGRG